MTKKSLQIAMAKEKRTKGQSMIYRTEIKRLTNTNPTKDWGVYRCFVRIMSSYTNSGIRHVIGERPEHHLVLKSCWKQV